MSRIRLAFGLIALIAAAWAGYSFAKDEALFEQILAILSALGAWLGSEFVPDRDLRIRLHPHDVALGNKIRERFSAHFRTILRDHSFGASFRPDFLNPIWTTAEWTGAEYEFENPELDNLGHEIVRLSGEIANKLSEYAGPVGNGDRIAIPNQRELGDDWFEPITAKRIDEVNRLARDLAKSLDDFERLFRKLSPESFENGQK